MVLIGCGDPRKEQCIKNIDQLRGKSNISIARTSADVYCNFVRGYGSTSTKLTRRRKIYHQYHQL